MNNLPLTIFAAEHCSSPQGNRRELLAATNFCAKTLHFEEEGEFGSDILCDVLNCGSLTVAVSRGTAISSLVDRFPAADGGAERITQTNVVPTRVHGFVPVRVALNDFFKAPVIALE